MSYDITAYGGSCAFHVLNFTRTPAYLPCSHNAIPLHYQCNSFGGLCNGSANRVQSRCKSLNTVRQLSASCC